MKRERERRERERKREREMQRERKRESEAEGERERGRRREKTNRNQLTFLRYPNLRKQTSIFTFFVFPSTFVSSLSSICFQDICTLFAQTALASQHCTV